jgi:hypothetical protein
MNINLSSKGFSSFDIQYFTIELQAMVEAISKTTEESFDIDFSDNYLDDECIPLLVGAMATVCHGLSITLNLSNNRLSTACFNDLKQLLMNPAITTVDVHWNYFTEGEVMSFLKGTSDPSIVQKCQEFPK